MKNEPKEHPLLKVFRDRGLNPITGMNWLQDYGLCSDLCVTHENVAAVDVARIVEEFGQ